MVGATETQPDAAEPRYIRYHPVIGGQYDPGGRITFRRPDGKPFEVRINAGGIRSNREYDFAKPKGVYRILVFGDSQSDGAFQPNELRFSELMEKRNPALEVINLSLPGAGTDQQLLNFEETGVKYAHDLVLLLPFLPNIRRNVSPTRASIDPDSGTITVRAKPTFELITGADGSEELTLHNVPVPEQPLWVEEPDAEADATPISWLLRKLEKTRENARKSAPARRLAYTLGPLLDVLGRTPYPEYRTPETYEWRLMAALLRRFAQGAGKEPVVIAPLVDSWYMRFASGKDYWRRFSSLADERIQVIDLLPHFLKLGRRAHECFFDSDPHFSDLGHVVLADAIEAELRRLRFLPEMGRSTPGR